MQTQQFLSRLAQSFEEECSKIINQSNQNDHQIKLVQTLRTSNKVEIANIVAKFKRLLIDILNQTLSFIEKECNLFLNEQIFPVSKYLSQLEYQKKIISQQEQQITDLLLDNMQFQAQLKDTNFKNNLTHSYIIEIDQLNQKIEVQEIQIEQLKIQLDKMQQQIKDFEILQKSEQKPEKINQKHRIQERKKTLDQYYDEYESPKTNFVKIEVENLQKKEEQFQKTKEISCQSEITGQSEINLCESQFISKIVNKKQRKQNQNDLINLSSIVRQVKLHTTNNKFPSIKNETIIIEKSTRNQSIQFNRPKKMDDLSRSQRNSSVNINMDHYYEAPPTYRYDVLNKTRKLS